jgi:hypothetical protein
MHILHAKEHRMNTDLNLAATTLRQRELHRIVDAKGALLQCLHGTVWLTQHGDRRDIVLEPGDEAVIEHDGLSIVTALSDARIVLAREAFEPARSLLGRIARHLPSWV